MGAHGRLNGAQETINLSSSRRASKFANLDLDRSRKVEPVFGRFSSRACFGSAARKE
jgi:hypothetical protein